MSQKTPNKKQIVKQLTDVNTPLVLKAGGAIGVLIVATLAFLVLFERLLPLAVPDSSETLSEQTIENNSHYSRMSLDQLQELNRLKLHHYGWVDRQEGVVRIPIDQAMNVMLDRGFPTRDRLAPPTLAQDMAVPGDVL